MGIVALPDDVRTVQVRHRVLAPSGHPLAGQVAVVPQAARWHTGSAAALLATPALVEVDASGEVVLTLPAVDDPVLAPTGVTYRVTEQVPGGRTFHIAPRVAQAPGPVDLRETLVDRPSSGGDIVFTAGPATDESMAQVANDPGSAFRAALTGTFVAQADTGSAGLAVLAAALPADARQALDIRTDTSVGTRVFVGNTMIYGDTGWRDIRSLITSPDIASVTAARLRRVNATVQVYVEYIYTATISGNNVKVLDWLMGFAPPFQMYGPNAYGGTKVVWYPTHVLAFGAIAGATVRMGSTWQTPDAWPTTLPGTPV